MGHGQREKRTRQKVEELPYLRTVCVGPRLEALRECGAASRVLENFLHTKPARVAVPAKEAFPSARFPADLNFVSPVFGTQPVRWHEPRQLLGENAPAARAQKNQRKKISCASSLQKQNKKNPTLLVSASSSFCPPCSSPTQSCRRCGSSALACPGLHRLSAGARNRHRSRQSGNTPGLCSAPLLASEYATPRNHDHSSPRNHDRRPTRVS